MRFVKFGHVRKKLFKIIVSCRTTTAAKTNRARLDEKECKHAAGSRAPPLLSYPSEQDCHCAGLVGWLDGWKDRAPKTCGRADRRSLIGSFFSSGEVRNGVVMRFPFSSVFGVLYVCVSYCLPATHLPSRFVYALTEGQRSR